MPSYEFTSSQRLLTSKQYQWVFDNTAKKLHSEHFLLVVTHPINHDLNNKNSDSKDTSQFFEVNLDKKARLGLVITKKKLKKATDRNYIKRIARESFRKACPSFLPVDCVLLVKKSPLVYSKALSKKSKACGIKELCLYDELTVLFVKLEKTFNKSSLS